MRLVIKYGGTSIDSPAKVASVARFLASAARRGEAVAVCSAAGGATDDLIETAARAGAGDRRGAGAAAARTAARTRRLASGSAPGAAGRRLLAALEADLAELAGLVDGMAMLGEVTPRSSDYLLSFGERLSSKILAHAVAGLGKRAQAMTGGEAGIVTDSNFGESRPLMDTTRLRVSKNVGALLSRGTLPVIGGFAGADQHGRPTTFGRGGSDYTATIVGSCIRADEIWLMSDVDGLMTADPRIVRGAGVIREVSYAEATEMAMFGAKQIHPRTFEPLIGRRIPMRIRSSAGTGDPGTLVSHSAGGGGAVKCVSALRRNSLIDIRGASMVGSPGTAAGIFSALAGAGVNVMMISQNPSESSISIVVKKPDMDRAAGALEIGPLGSSIGRLEVTPDVAIVALIGSGMRGTPGVASRVFGSVAARGINVVMVTQGSSELNLAFVVRDSDCAAAVRALHDEFGLAAAAPGRAGRTKKFKETRPPARR